LQNVERGYPGARRGDLAELPEAIRQSQDGESGQKQHFEEAERDIAAVPGDSGQSSSGSRPAGHFRRTLQYRLKEYGLVDSDIAE
jgi:hypothetical protein